MPGLEAWCCKTTDGMIEILSVDLLHDEQELVKTFRDRAHRLGIEMGWHYLLDMAWIGRNLGNPDGKRILDAGAGTGLMQWWLAERGAEVVSVDRSSRAELSGRFRMAYRVRGLRMGDLYNQRQLIWHRLQDASMSLARRIIGVARAAISTILASLLPKAKGEVVIYNHDLDSMPDLADNSFDYVVALSSLEHNSPEALSVIVHELIRILKPGGCLLATLAAARDVDWFHEPSRGWCYTEDSLREVFNLTISTPSNYDKYDLLFEQICLCEELKQDLSPFYFRSGDNGMPWGVWDPKYQPVGIMKRKVNDAGESDPG